MRAQVSLHAHFLDIAVEHINVDIDKLVGDVDSLRLEYERIQPDMCCIVLCFRMCSSHAMLTEKCESIASQKNAADAQLQQSVAQYGQCHDQCLCSQSNHCRIKLLNACVCLLAVFRCNERCAEIFNLLKSAEDEATAAGAEFTTEVPLSAMCVQCRMIGRQVIGASS